MDFENDYDDFEEDGFADDEDIVPWDGAKSDDPMPDEHDCDTFTATDAFFIGGMAMNWAYEEGFDEGRRRSRRRKRRHDADDDFI